MILFHCYFNFPLFKGSILEKVRIIGYDDDSETATDTIQEATDIRNDTGASKKRKNDGNICDDSVGTDTVYVTRFLESSGSSSFLIVRIQSILKR